MFSCLVIPTSPKFQSVVEDLIRTANRTLVENFVRDFSGFFNRGYQTDWGEQSQKWLLSQIESILSGHNGNSFVTEVDHGWRQNSLIARIEGSHTQLKSEIVILGAHQDSLNLVGADARAPGITAMFL